jgi:hypothetical protein
MREERGAHRVLVGTPEGKKPLGRPRHRWEDNIKMDVQEVGVGRVDWIELAQDRDRLEKELQDVQVRRTSHYILVLSPFHFAEKNV